MPKGKSRTLAERKARHKKIYGSLKDFSKQRGYKRKK